jgi:hypothetical protein
MVERKIMAFTQSGVKLFRNVRWRTRSGLPSNARKILQTFKTAGRVGGRGAGASEKLNVRLADKPSK